MATKPSTIYSTNPKMDTSGVSAAKPVYGYQGTQVGTKAVSGGELYGDAIDAQADEYGMGKAKRLSTPETMKAAARLVGQGYSCDHAMDIVSKETINMPDNADVVKMSAKLFTKTHGK